MTRVIETSLIKVFWRVFGYAFVGFISLIYGVILQDHNYGDRFRDLFANDDNFRHFYLVIFLIIILLNLLFAHAYATLYGKIEEEKGMDLEEKEEKKKIQEGIYTMLGHWLETSLVVVIIAYLIPIIAKSDNYIYALIIAVVVCLHWCVCIGFYRTFLKVQKMRFEKKQINFEIYECVKYKLIVPAMLMIASNIYMASCIGEVWDGQIEYFGLMVVLDIFILGYTIYDFLDYRFRKNKNDNLTDTKTTKEQTLEQAQEEVSEPAISKHELFPIACFFILLVSGAAINVYVAQYEQMTFLDTPIRSMFLACFVAVYLAMFEGWFIIKDSEGVSNVAIKKGIDYILVYMPVIVCLFFPFQDFEFMYFVFFVIGHNYTRWYWVNSQKPTDTKHQNLAIMRAILGTITLIALIIDKKFPLKVVDVLGNLINMDAVTDVSIILGAVELGLCVLPIRNFALKNVDGSVIGYFFTVVFLILFMYVAKIDGKEKIFLSIIAMLVFIVFECYIFSKNAKKVGVKTSEKE